MDESQQVLWNRLRAYDLAGDGSPVSFSGKLARQNRWSRVFTLRVIEEYKRFAFLSVVAGHPVAPSDIVDQPWHLHLMDTEEYWSEFCDRVLGKRLHHQPSKGSLGEEAKFEDWYRQTLVSYERLFGAPAAVDIWPDPGSKHGKAPNHVRVDQASHWIIPKPAISIRAWLAAGVGILVTVGCAGVAAGPNPFDWAGPDFLAFYFLLYVACLVLAWFARSALRQPAKGDLSLLDQLDPYEIGYLAGGPQMAATVAIAGLVHGGSLVVDPVAGTVHTAPPAVPPVARSTKPIDVLVYGAVISATKGAIWHVRGRVARSLGSIESDLQARGLLLSGEQAQLATIVPFVLALIGPIAGVLKIAVGISRDRPVQILVVLVFASLVANALVFLRKPLRSRLGDAALGEMRRKNARFRQAGATPIGSPSQDLMLGVALFGVSTLAGTPLSGLQTALLPPQSHGFAGIYSTCGSCSSGVGSSCGGGGGGGGGGCGGCSSG